MMRRPTGFFINASGLLETVQPVPFEERRRLPRQAIPTLSRHIADLSHNSHAQLGCHQEAILARATKPLNYATLKRIFSRTTEDRRFAPALDNRRVRNLNGHLR